MSYEIVKTINRKSIINDFHLFMKPDSPMRIMRLMGEEKTGKSHLATKIFPERAEKDHQARFAIMDLRHPMQTIPDILHTICGRFHDKKLFSNYYAPSEKSTGSSRTEITKGLAIFSNVHITTTGETDETDKIRELTNKFIEDIRNLKDVPFLLIFDTVDKANGTIHKWLIEDLLTQLIYVTHLRVVLSGISVPYVTSFCKNYCRDHKLLPVSELEEYISYCRQIGATLQEQSIRDFALAFDYKPGFFAEMVNNDKFVPIENIYG